MATPRKSKVWKVFQLITVDGQQFTKCSICEPQLAYNSSTSAMLKHLEKMHSIQHAELFPEKVKKSTNTKRKLENSESTQAQSSDPIAKRIKIEPEQPTFSFVRTTPYSGRLLICFINYINCEYILLY